MSVCVYVCVSLTKLLQEAKEKPTKAPADIKAKVVKKRKDDTKKQNTEELFQPDGTSKETPPAKAPTGSAKAREEKPQPSPLSCLENLKADLDKTKQNKTKQNKTKTTKQQHNTTK